MNNFLTQLPIIIATLSKALLRAIKEQILEVVRAIQKFIRHLWLTYLKMESSVLGTVLDVGFSIYALRQFFTLVAIGLLFLYFHWWWVFFAYVAIIAVAILRFFTMPPAGTGDQAEAHIKNKEKIIAFLRIPLRILFSLVIIYLSWSFNFFGIIEFHNLFAKNPEAIQSFALVNSIHGSRLQLTQEQLWLALTRFIPTGSGFRQNNLITWHDVSQNLPRTRIEIIGPDEGYVRDEINKVLASGCHDYVSRLSLRIDDRTCSTIREDGVYILGPSRDYKLVVQKLAANPQAFGFIPGKVYADSADIVRAVQIHK